MFSYLLSDDVLITGVDALDDAMSKASEESDEEVLDATTASDDDMDDVLDSLVCSVDTFSCCAGQKKMRRAIPTIAIKAMMV